MTRQARIREELEDSYELMDFSNPIDARKFLRDYRYDNGKPLTMIELPNKQGYKDAHALNDLEACHYAWEILTKGLQQGHGYMEDTTVH